MTETYYAGVYWPGRSEPVASYARRAEVLFQGLAILDPILERWHEQAGSRATALKSQFTPNVATLTELFSKPKYQRGVGDLSFSAWNGEGPSSSEVSLSCGSRSPSVVDFCSVTPPLRGPASERLLTSHALSRMLRSMALAWDPEWGVATSEAHRDLISERATAGTFTGWVMYFSKRRGRVPPLPAPVAIEPVEDLGTLVVLTSERFSVGNPGHIALAAQVQELLESAGLLGPLTASRP